MKILYIRLLIIHNNNNKIRGLIDCKQPIEVVVPRRNNTPGNTRVKAGLLSYDTLRNARN